MTCIYWQHWAEPHSILADEDRTSPGSSSPILFIILSPAPGGAIYHGSELCLKPTTASTSKNKRLLNNNWLGVKRFICNWGDAKIAQPAWTPLSLRHCCFEPNRMWFLTDPLDLSITIDSQLQDCVRVSCSTWQRPSTLTSSDWF